MAIPWGPMDWPWENHGLPMAVPWNCNKVPWNLKRIPWNGHGTETKFHGICQNSMELKVKGKSMEFEESSMELIKIPWNFKKFHGI